MASAVNVVMLGLSLASLRATRDLAAAVDVERESRALREQLRAGSRLLTNEVRAFAVTGDDDHLCRSWEEIEVTRSRDEAVAGLERLGTPTSEPALVEQRGERQRPGRHRDPHHAARAGGARGRTGGDARPGRRLQAVRRRPAPVRQ